MLLSMNLFSLFAFLYYPPWRLSFLSFLYFQSYQSNLSSFSPSNNFINCFNGSWIIESLPSSFISITPSPNSTFSVYCFLTDSLGVVFFSLTLSHDTPFLFFSFIWINPKACKIIILLLIWSFLHLLNLSESVYWLIRIFFPSGSSSSLCTSK